MNHPRTIGLAWAIAATVAVAVPAAGGKSGVLPPGATAYLHDSKTDYSQPEWMARLSDTTQLDRISMVGTHDSASYYGGDIVQTQSLSIADQLDMGVRCLDLRCKHIRNGLQVYHGIVDQKMKCRDFVVSIVQFLRQHPTETVLLRVAEEDRGAKNTNTFEEAFLTEIYNYDYSKITPPGAKPTRESPFYVGPILPPLGKVRGKIYILQSFNGNAYGQYYDDTLLPDTWKMKTNWDLYDKWERVKKNLETTMAGKPVGRFYVNALNASVGSFPYFVVSGKSSPQTNAPQLATGFTTPGWKSKYPDFPRVACVAGICTIAFMGTNQLTDQYIRAKAKDRKPGNEPFVGLISTDFPGPSLVDAVIHANHFVK